MIYEWDEAKDLVNQRKHGLSFGKIYSFDWDYAICIDTRLVDLEERELWIGPISPSLCAVVTTERINSIRLISLRRATQAEIALWRKEFQDGQ